MHTYPQQYAYIRCTFGSISQHFNNVESTFVLIPKQLPSFRRVSGIMPPPILQHLLHICDNVGDIVRSLGGIILYIDNIEITIVQLPGLRRVSDYEFLLFAPNLQHLMHNMNTFAAQVYLFPSVLIESRYAYILIFFTFRSI